MGVHGPVESPETGSRRRPWTQPYRSAVRQPVAQRLADRAGGEGPRVGERHEVVIAEAAEELGVLVHERLGERDVEQQRAHPVEAAPRVGLEAGELARDEVLDGLGHLAALPAGAAPLVDAETDLLGDEV